MYTANIHVTLKKTVLDPQGVTVMSSLKSLGFNAVSDARVGKFLRITLDAASPEEAASLVADMCKKLLANPVIEDFTFDIVPGGVSR